MALDPSIALDFHPAQIAPPESPLAAYGQALQIANGAQNLQAGQQKLQSNALELKQQQQAAAAQDALNRALKENTTIDPTTGQMHIDQAGATKSLVNAGYGQKAMELNNSIRDSMNKAMAAEGERLKVGQAQTQQLADIAASVGKVNQDETDPIKKAQDVAGWQARAANALNLATSKGVLPPQVAQTMLPKLAAGWSPELETQIDGLAQAATTYAQHHTAVHEDLQDLNATLNGQATRKREAVQTQESQQKLNDLQKSSLAGPASQVSSLADYQAALGADKTGAAKALPQNLTEDDFKPENLAKTQERIRTSVMNADQLAAYNLHKDAQADRDLTAKSNAQARQFHEQIMGVLAEGKESPGAKLARTQIEKDTAQEIALRNKLATLNAQLGTDGTKTPTVYVPDNPREQPVLIERKLGNPVNPDDAAAVAKREKDRQGLIADMQARRTNLLSQLGNVVNHKYDVADKVGVGGSTSRDEVLGDLEKMGWKAPTPPAAKAAPATAPATAPASQTPPPAASAPAKPAAGAPQKAAPDGEVRLTLPGGKVKVFPSQKAAKDFAAAAGLQMQ